MIISPIMIGAFVTVTALNGVLAFVFRGSSNANTATRLDILVGKKKQDVGSGLLKKNHFEDGQKTFLEMLTTRIPNLKKYFDQADCHIKPNSLIVIGLALGVVGVTASWLARGPIFFWPLAGCT